MAKGSQNGVKIELWVFRNQIFSILGGLLWWPIFDEILVGKKLTQKSKNEGQRELKLSKGQSFHRPGGKRGGAGGNIRGV